MDIQRRVIGQSVIVARSGEVTGIDVDTLLHRLLLFDGYVLRTVRFKEVPFLLEAFGFDQTIELFKSGLLEIRCKVNQIGSERDAELRNQQKPVFSLVWIEAHDWDEYVTKCLREVESQLTLTDAKWETLKSSVRSCVRRLEWQIKQEIAASFIRTIEDSPTVLAESLRLASRRRRLPIVFPNFEIHAERGEGDLIRVESNLRYTRIPRDELWEIIRDGLMGVGALEQAIGEMKNYSAIGGFSAEELPVFESKLSFLAHLADSGTTEKRATRIAKLTGMPLFDSQKARLNVDKLLRIRESDDLRTFRDWLATSDGKSDESVRRLLKGYRARLSGVLRGGSGTMIRLMAEGVTGVGHPVAGFALSLLDGFLLERLFPHSGPAAFVNRTFPSLFEKRK